METARFEPATVEAGRHLFARPVTFLKGAVSIDDLPDDGRVEVAFAGRSNVGKSSLLNALAGRNGLARTSSMPGRTQELNFFEAGDGLYIVDMPGYGYARAGKRKSAGWQTLIRQYLRGRPQLRRVFLLVDARHGLKPSDEEIMALLDEAAVSYQIVLTKADKLPAAAVAEVVARVTGALVRHGAAHPHVHVTSSLKNTGIEDLRAEIAALVAQ